MHLALCGVQRAYSGHNRPCAACIGPEVGATGLLRRAQGLYWVQLGLCGVHMTCIGTTGREQRAQSLQIGHKRRCMVCTGCCLTNTGRVTHLMAHGDCNMIFGGQNVVG